MNFSQFTWYLNGCCFTVFNLFSYLCFAYRFLLQFVVGSGLDQGVATLHVVETNPFKHLTHLSLKLLPGSDSEVKKYLANCLKNLQVSFLITFLAHKNFKAFLQCKKVIVFFRKCCYSQIKDFGDCINLSVLGFYIHVLNMYRKFFSTMKMFYMIKTGGALHCLLLLSTSSPQSLPSIHTVLVVES